MNALLQPHYLLFFCTNTLSMLGLWMLRLSLGWLAWQITESTFWTSMIALAILGPSGILGPIIAVYAENWHMRKASILTHLAMTVVIGIIWLLNITIGHTPISLLVLSTLFGIIIAVYHPIRLVLISMLVSKQYLLSAVGLNASAFSACRIVGPALAGMSLASIGLSYTLFLAMLLYIPIQVGLMKVHVRTREKREEQVERFLERLKNGIGYALKHKPILYALGIVGINSFFVRGLIEIQPAIIGQVLGGSSQDLAIATTAGGVGALIASALLGFGAVGKHHLQTILFPSSLAGLLGCCAMPFVDEIIGLSMTFLLIGFTVTATGIISQSFLQLAVDENYRARVLTWWATFSFGGLSLGGLTLGLLGEFTQIQYAVAGAALLGILAHILWFIIKKPGRTIDGSINRIP